MFRRARGLSGSSAEISAHNLPYSLLEFGYLERLREEALRPERARLRTGSGRILACDDYHREVGADMRPDKRKDTEPFQILVIGKKTRKTEVKENY